jgi:hypothetical protein
LLRIFLVISVACLFSGCAKTQPEKDSSKEAVKIVLEGVDIRQYKKGKQRFQIKAKKLVLDEDQEELKAIGNIYGKLESNMWSRRKQ